MESVISYISDISGIKVDDIKNRLKFFSNYSYTIGDNKSREAQYLNKKIVIIFEFTKNSCNHYHLLIEYLNILFLLNQTIFNFLKIENQSIEIFFHTDGSYKLSQEDFSELNKYIKYYNLPFIINTVSKNNVIINSEFLFIIQKNFDSTHVSRLLLEFLRKNLSTNQQNKKIIINRSSITANRQLTREFINNFEKIGYEQHEIENYSLQEQSDLFNSSSHIICAHGAALANLVYCQNNTKVIELNPGFNPTCYSRLSKYLNNKLNIYINHYTLFDNTIYYENANIVNITDDSRYNYNKDLIKDENNKYREIINRDIFTNKNPVFINFKTSLLKNLT